MSAILRAVFGILWPPAAPISATATPRDNRVWWTLLCILQVIPLTAIWHHAVFYRPRCMLNDFGPEYTADIVAKWLSRDPSLPWAILCAIVIYAAGRRWEWMQMLAAPFFLAFIPLSLWIWDIPFTDRWICHHGHDKRPFPGLEIVIPTRYLYMLKPDGPDAWVVSLGIIIRTRYLYMLGGLIYAAGLTWLTTRRWRSPPSSQPRVAV